MGRRFAIGDVHGQAGALAALLDVMSPRPDDHVIFLGDLIDRGPSSPAVIEMVMSLSESANVSVVFGNHEEMMLAYAQGALDLRTWVACGGGPTLSAYDELGDECFDRHCAFLLSKCVPFVLDRTHFFVHGTADPSVPCERQTSETLRWKRFGDPAPHMSGRVLVAGHTPQKSGVPRVFPHAVCIDTFAYGGEFLTAFSVDESLFLQAREDGETRTMSFAEALRRTSVGVDSRA